jgi:hypothetical protein
MTTTATAGGTLNLSFTSFTVPTTVYGSWPRATLTQEASQSYDLPLENFVVHDAPQTRLPGTPAEDDLGIVGATYGTNAITLITNDQKSNDAVTTLYGRTTYRLPPEYVAGQSVQIALAAGANTTVADTSMTVDVEACKVHLTDGSVGADLVETAAQACNNLVAATKTFTLDASGLAPGDKLDIRVALAIRDNAGGDAVKSVINNARMVLSIKG